MFTRAWVENPEVGESRVAIDFSADGDGTKLVLVREGLPTVEQSEKHTRGWIGCLDHLARTIS